MRKPAEPNVVIFDDRAALAEKKFRKQFVRESKDSDDFNVQWEHLNRQIDRIRSHLLTQTNKGQGTVRSMFEGIYYFHGEFWEVRVPIVMGSPPDLPSTPNFFRHFSRRGSARNFKFSLYHFQI